LSPLMAPQVAMAAETPQMDTAEERMTANSLSTLSLPASQKQEYQTANTTPRAWRMPSRPACRISGSRMPAPMSTSPVLM